MFLYGAFLYLTSTFFGFFRARFFFFAFPSRDESVCKRALGRARAPFRP